MATTLIRLETKKINQKVSELSKSIIESHQGASKALAKLDIEAAQEIIDQTKIINAKYLDIEADLEFLITKAPVDKDLRRTLAYLSISKELKRISDYAKHIAKYVITMNVKARKSSVAGILDIHKILMVNMSGLPKLLETENFDMAIEIARSDKKVDAKLLELRHIFIESIGKKKDFEGIDEKIFALAMAARLERAGDHIVKICEMIIYINNGQHVFLD